MKNKCLCFILSGLAAVFVAVSCAGTPPAPDTATEGAGTSQGPDQAALNALNNAAARAEAARKMLSDFDAPLLFPSDWESAESLFGQAERQKNTSTSERAQESAALYTKAAEAYEALLGKTLAQYYENKAKELSDARDAAVNAGVQALVPDFLLETDNTAADAEGKYQAKDYYGAKADAGNALSMYTALKAGLEAYKLREEIADRAEELIPDILLEVDTIGLDAIAKWEAKDYNGAKTGAIDALSMYAVLKAGKDAYEVREKIAERAETLFPDSLSQADYIAMDAFEKWDAKDYNGAKDAASTAWIMYLSVAASTERQTALDLKANTAVRQDFNAAEAIYAQANAAYRGQRYEEAVPLFEECLSIFRMTSQLALEKRLAAEEALRKAEQKAVESDEAAKNAEAILQGGV
jgi:hypothetical protein